MRLARGLYLPALAAALLLAVSASAAEPVECFEPTGKRGEDVAAARALFDRALGLEPAAPEAALRALFCAERLTANAAVALRIGTIAERLGRHAAAAGAFERYLERAGDQAPDAEPMLERIRRLREKAATEAPRPAAVPSADSAQQLAGWALGASGLGLGIIGAVLLGVAKAHSDEVHELAPGTVAWDSDEARGLLQRAQREQAAGIVAVVVGATAAALGVVLLASAEASETDDSAELSGWLSPGAAGASLRLCF